MRLTTRTNLAGRVLMFCAVHPDQYVRTGDIAKLCNCSTNHVAHVVQQLHANGYVDTLRGRAGGLRLARPAGEISIGAMFRLFEGDIPLAECFDPEANKCPLVGACRLRGYMLRALEAFYRELDTVTLADLVQGNCGLAELLAMQPVPPAICGSQATL